MARSGKKNSERFPGREDEKGNRLCRVCGKILTGRKTSFCGRRCLRDFWMKTDWKRVRMVVYYRDGGICMKCGKGVSLDNFHVDHIDPICNGGAEWDLDNLELSCPKCNLSKGSKNINHQH